MYASFLGNFPHRKFCLLKSVLVEDKIKSLVAISRPFFALLLHLKKCRMLSRTAFAQMAFVIMHKEELVRILPLPDLLHARGNYLSRPVSREKS